MKHKFHAVRSECDGINFSSKKERQYFQSLQLLKKNGDILFFLMQVPFHLPGNIIYRLDFMEFWKPAIGQTTGEIIFTEVKGFMTRDAKIKIQQAEELYGIKINVV